MGFGSRGRLTGNKTIAIGAPQTQLIWNWMPPALSGLAAISAIKCQLEFHQLPSSLSTLDENELDAKFQHRKGTSVTAAHGVLHSQGQ